MPGWISRWLEALRSVGAAGIGLLQAELDALVGDLRETGQGLGKGLLWLGAALLFAAIALVGASVAVFEGLVLVVPRWVAALILTGAAGLAAVIFAVVGRSVLRRLESPAASVRRRAESHLDWWSRTLGDGRALPPEAEGDEE